MKKPIERALLPFVSGSLTDIVFNNEVETATIFCLIELAREKGGGFFKKQAAEKLVYTSKIYYPFWLAPNRDSTFILDGLNATDTIMNYQILPNTKEFKTKLNEMTTSPETYANFLSNHQNYFQNIKEQNQFTIEGLLSDPDFEIEFTNYAKEAKITDSTISDAVLITPAINEQEATKIIQKTEATRLKLTEELTELTGTIKLLNTQTQNLQATLRERKKAVEERFSAELQKTKTRVDIKIAEINKKYLDTVTELTTKYNEKTKNLEKEALKSKKEMEQLDGEIEKAETEIKTAAINKDDSAEIKWKEKRNELKEQRQATASVLKEQENQVVTNNEIQKSELVQLKQNNDTQIREVNKELLEIEASRDVEIQALQKGIEKLEDMSATIIKNIDELAKNREAAIAEFEALGTRQQRTNATLFFMPFYLASFQSKTNRRYVYIPPSKAIEDSLTTRLKGLGKTKISQLLEPRSRRIQSILNKFITLLDENVVFSREISEACLKTNIIQKEKDQKAIKNGLSKLNSQGWLSSSELAEFNEALTRSTQ